MALLVALPFLFWASSTIVGHHRTGLLFRHHKPVFFRNPV
jgi:hypothetical protein